MVADEKVRSLDVVQVGHLDLPLFAGRREAGGLALPLLFARDGDEVHVPQLRHGLHSEEPFLPDRGTLEGEVCVPEVDGLDHVVLVPLVAKLHFVVEVGLDVAGLVHVHLDLVADRAGQVDLQVLLHLQGGKRARTLVLADDGILGTHGPVADAAQRDRLASRYVDVGSAVTEEAAKLPRNLEHGRKLVMEQAARSFLSRARNRAGLARGILPELPVAALREEGRVGVQIGDHRGRHLDAPLHVALADPSGGRIEADGGVSPGRPERPRRVRPAHAPARGHLAVSTREGPVSNHGVPGPGMLPEAGLGDPAPKQGA